MRKKRALKYLARRHHRCSRGDAVHRRSGLRPGRGPRGCTHGQHEHAVGGHRRHPGHLHAGGVRPRGDRLLPVQARRPRREHELRHLRARLHRLLLRRLPAGLRGLRHAALLRRRTGRTDRRRADRQRQLHLPVRRRVGVVGRRHQRRRARLLPLHGGLHGHRGHDPHRRDGRAVEVGQLRHLGPVLRRHLLPAVRGVDVGRRMAVQDVGQLRLRRRIRRLRRQRRRARRRWSGGAGRGARPRPAHREVRRRRQTPSARQPPHPDGHARHVHPAVRLVRLQRRLDVRRVRRPVRHRGDEHRHRRRRSAPSWQCSSPTGGWASRTPG